MAIDALRKVVQLSKSRLEVLVSMLVAVKDRVEVTDANYHKQMNPLCYSKNSMQILKTEHA
jgi:hypothetical protein